MTKRTYYDLCASTTQLEPETQRERAAVALSLGFEGVAMVHQGGTRLAENTDKCTIRTVQLDELLSAAKGFSSAAQNTGCTVGSPYRAVQLTRLNIPVEDTNAAQEACANKAVVDSYDLLAAQPESERAFAFACTTLNVDIISVDLSKRLSIRFKPELIKAAVNRGVYFEITYAAALREGGLRRQLFTNAQALTRATRGRNVVISSGANSMHELRGAHDVINLGTFLGLTEQQAQDSVSKNAVAVVEHARRRKAYRATLTLRMLEPGENLSSPAVEAAKAMDIDKMPDKGNVT